MDKNTKVRYVGSSDTRTITEANWKAAVVQSDEAAEVTWDAGNDWTLDRNDLGFLTDEEFDRLIRRDPGFRVDDGEGPTDGG